MNTSGVRSADPEAQQSLVERYDRDGFLVVPDVLAPDRVAALLAQTTGLCRGEYGDIDGVVPARGEESDADVLRRYLCIHFPHKLSPLMAAVAAEPAIVDVLRAVIGPNVKLVQSMLFIKTEGKPGQAWHQDECFIPTRDRSLTAAWVALDAATTENGCLWVIPGSHRAGVLYPDREQDDERFDCTSEAYGFAYRDDEAVPVEVPAGAMVLFSGYLLHRSLPNNGTRGMRRSLVCHYMSAESLLPWQPPGDSEWMGKADLRDIVLVAGQDPYAFRGTVDFWKPHVRAAGDGGCRR